MFKAGIAFFLGASVVSCLPTLPSLWVIAPSVTFILFAFFFKKIRLLALVVIGFSFALLSAYQQIEQRLPAIYEAVPVIVAGTISSLPTSDYNRQVFNFSVTRSYLTNDTAKESLDLSKLRLSLYNSEERLALGQQWRFHVQLKRPHGRFNQVGFLYENWLWAKGFNATGNIKQTELLAKSPTWYFAIREYFAEQLNTLLENHPHKALIMALAVADRSGLDYQLQTLMQNTGTTHLLAISGLHIGLASVFFWYVAVGVWHIAARLLKTRIVAKQIFAAYGALFGAGFYALLAGFSAPTLRAFILLACYLVAIICYRRVRWSTAIGFALIFITVLHPFAVLDASFYLSFAAVFIIAFVNQGRLYAESRFKQKITIFGRTQLAITFVLLPVLLFTFGKAAFVSALANVVAVPFASLLLVPLVLIFLLLTPLFASPILASSMSYVNDAVQYLLAQCFTAFLFILKKFEALPFAYFYSQQLSLALFAVVLFALFIVLLPKAVPGKLFVLIVLVPFMFPKTNPIPVGEFRMDILDVGQGLSVLIQTQQHSLLYDAGPAFLPNLDSGRDIVLPTMRHQAIKALDMLLISHRDNDHRGGAAAILQAMPVKHVRSSQLDWLAKTDTAHAPAKNCQRGQQWQWDGVRFEILHPPDYWFTEDNDSSCVLKIYNDHVSVLLPGDLEWLGEFELLDYYQDQREVLRADILISPHHGSRSSSSLAFVKHVKPDWVIHSAGYQHYLGLPHQEVIDRYHQHNARQLLTSNTGQMTFWSEWWPEQWAWQTAREQRKRFWHWPPPDND